MFSHSLPTRRSSLFAFSPVLLSSYHERCDGALNNMADPMNNNYAKSRLMLMDNGLYGDGQTLCMRACGPDRDSKVLNTKIRSQHFLWGGKCLDQKSKILRDPPKVLEVKKRRYTARMTTDALAPPIATGYYELQRHQQEMWGVSAETRKSEKK